MKEVPSVLFILRGASPPKKDITQNVYGALSKHLRGDLVTTTWKITDEELKESQAAMGNFNLHRFPLSKARSPLNSFFNLYNLFRTSFTLCRQNEYDAIVTYGPYLNSVIALVFSKIFKVPLIVQVPGHPVNGFLTREKGGALSLDKIKKIAAKGMARFVCKHADFVRTLYPEQLESLNIETRKTSVFHEWVPVTALSKSPPVDKPDKEYILTMGMPWYIKGVDILIKAFLEIADDYPELHLKVVGFEVSDRDYFEGLAGDHPRIELCKPVESDEAYEILKATTLFALASRTEAMGRVLLESMAFGVPIVASRVDGIPHYVEDGVTGLLVEPENVSELAMAIKKSLDEKPATEKRIKAAREKLLSSYNEDIYVEEFSKMVKELVKERSTR